MTFSWRFIPRPGIKTSESRDTFIGWFSVSTVLYHSGLFGHCYFVCLIPIKLTLDEIGLHFNRK